MKVFWFGYVTCWLTMTFTPAKAQEIIFQDDFDTKDLYSNWRAEFEYPDSAWLKIKDGVLSIASKAGATLWFKQQLTGDLMIVYDRKVCVDSGAYDRLSDFNQFWLANEVIGGDSLIQRDGALDSYNQLKLFYVGIGGNYNSTTRFRKYDGTGNRILINEKNERMNLLEPNVYYHIKIVVSPSKGETLFFINDRLLFQYKGLMESSGYFGFRLTHSRQEIKNFKVYRQN